MKLHRVRIDNFRGLQNLSVGFCDELEHARPLTIVVGPNMSGKTTLLDAMHLVYACVENAQHPTFRPEFDPNDPANRWDANQPISVDLTFALEPGEWQALDELEKRLGAPGFAVERRDVYRVSFQWPPPAKSYRGVVQAEPWNASLALRGRATAKVAKAKRLVEEGVFEHIGGLLYLDQHRSVDMGAPSVATGSEEHLREQAGARALLPWLELQSRLHQKWDAQSQGESAWARVKRLYGLLAAPAAVDDIKAFDEGFDLRFRRGDRFYYSAGLSSGERQILRLVVNLTALRAVRSVVLIDEVELHLHPAWQRNVLHFCRSGGGDSNQFIVTTHSESLLRYADPSEVVRLGIPEQV